MKYTALLFALFVTVSMTAQLTVDTYPVEIEANIDDIKALPMLTAQSTCGAVTVELNESIFSGGCLGNLVRTFIFTDACGNVKKAEQFVKLKDTTPPVIEEVEPNLTATSTNDLPEAPTVTATDNSNEKVTVSLTEKKVNDEVIRIWTAEDACGNTSIMKQTIKLTDL